MTARLLAIAPEPAVQAFDPATAAQESCKIVGTPGFYPSPKLSPSYVEHYTPVLEQRLILAGKRLAAMLNDTLR
jgi:nuclease S1